MGKEVGEGVDVFVNARDHFASGTAVVKAHVERQGVLGQVGPQLVGGAPAHHLGDVGGHGRKKLMEQGDDDEINGRLGQARQATKSGFTYLTRCQIQKVSQKLGRQ